MFNKIKNIAEHKIKINNFKINVLEKNNNFEISLNNNENELAKIILSNNLTEILEYNCNDNSIKEKFLLEIENVLICLKSSTLSIKTNDKEFFKNLNYIENNDLLIKQLKKKEPTIQDKYFKNGKLVNFPSKPNEKLEIYKIMKTWFEKDKKYSEPEINNIIKSKIECVDFATLRRDLVDNKILNRSKDGKEYNI